MEGGKIQIHYFDFGGAVADPIRLTLWKAKVEYDDVRYTREEHLKRKAEGFWPAG